MKSFIIATIALGVLVGCSTTTQMTLPQIWTEAHDALRQFYEEELSLLETRYPEFKNEIQLRREWNTLVEDLQTAQFRYLLHTEPSEISSDGNIWSLLLRGSSEQAKAQARVDPEFRRMLQQKDELKTKLKNSGERMRTSSYVNLKEEDKKLLKHAQERMDAKLRDLERHLRRWNKANHGLESTSASPAAGTLETRP